MLDTTWYVWAIVILAVAGFAASVSLVLDRGGLAGRRQNQSARSTGIAGFAVVAGWTGLSAALAGSGVYGQDAGPVPWIVVIFATFLIGLLAATNLPPVAQALESPGTLMRLTLPHTLRVFGVVFLIVMAQDSLPAHFALPAGLGDVAIGVAAPFVAWRLARGEGAHSAVWLNVLGLLDLVVALSLGFFLAPGPFQLLDVTPTTESLSMLPLALIPTVAVPTAIALHVLALRRLIRGSDRAPLPNTNLWTQGRVD